MLEAVGCRIFYLRRISIDRLYLDTSLKEGEFRSLTSEETECGKEFAETPSLFLNNRFEINIVVESEAELGNVISVLGKLRRMTEAEKAYNTKLGIESMAQLNQLGVPANVITDNSTTLNVTIKGNDGSEQTIHEVIELPDKNKQ